MTKQQIDSKKVGDLADEIQALIYTSRDALELHNSDDLEFESILKVLEMAHNKTWEIIHSLS